MRAHRCTLSQRKWTSGPEFKIAILLQPIATDPLGALRRAGASGDRAIAIAARDVPPRPRGAIYAEDRDELVRSRALDRGRLSCGAWADLQIVLSAFSIFIEPSGARTPTRVRPRKINDAVAF